MKTRTSFASASGAAVALGLLVIACGGSTANEGGTGGSAGTAGSAGHSGTGGSGGSGGGCDYQGQHYAEGQSWPSGGCSTCSCSNGQALCGKNVCSCTYNGQTYVAGETFPAGDGCNTCTCPEGGGTPICTKLACATGCDYNGVHYDVGQTWSLDACNSCSCMADGQVACTGAYCPPCTYAGKQYNAGETFPALDGCNTCTCQISGVSCTELACKCDPAKEWWRKYTATDPAQCATIKYTCPENTFAFQNACGCGCEQDSSCPPTIDCMPPSDCSALTKKCPFSGVAY